MMKMKTTGIFVILLLAVQLAAGVWLLTAAKPRQQDPAAVNELQYACAGKWEELQNGAAGDMPEFGSGYTILDLEGQVLYTSGQGLSLSLNDAVKRRDTILDLRAGGEAVGKLIIGNEDSSRQSAVLGQIAVLLAVIAALEGIIFFLYAIYLEKKVLRPFHRLKKFAARVAGGNLDMPLEMDQRNIFGAFTESFDLMREELKNAREREHAADQSKKELVAKLSHDIKTPVASIKAVAEVMAVSSREEKARGQLAVIEAKADQIDSLISNLFHATLEELQELKVAPEEQDSRLLTEMVETADYLNRAKIGEVPECLVFFDKLRLQQVLDNIIVNSYKYADTSIQVSFVLEKDCLAISCRDFGPGVPKEEEALLLQKYYRGKNAEGKNGSGLGLYISGYLMAQMDGLLQCTVLEDGFCAALKLKT